MLEKVVKQSHQFSPNSKLLIFGGGFSGQHIAAAARRLGAKVLCSRRSFNKTGADFIYDSASESIPEESVLKDVTHLISCIPPLDTGEDPVLKNLSAAIKKMPLKWAGYLSTTGVYGDCKGAWVNENDCANPKQARSIRRLACEKAWQSSGLPVQIIRLPGIYGPGRSTLEAIKNKKSKVIHKPGQVFSRIHIDDIAGGILHLINLISQGINPEIINLADNFPASNIEVMQYAAYLLNQELPPIESFEIAAETMSPMALSFWQENRKVSNKVLCKELGYSLIHPDYKSGLKDCLISYESKNEP
ncbi:SDR family oxidoreductase [Prochlorococcus marinus]|uniref:Nucleoside-diphosphate-sugar epimerase n=1 Tax=Prochlorococcus marinus (strain MIT 9211) TaxID=93059 RepID=A9B9I6_PROM4|nr:SDR family oxidoreductase [Prochlorococcus marinus]ABX07961.1 Nucleoside-diphosphate-sugar epimerase [Prochlorococcus marinus str. MIT 9211]